MLVGKSIEVKVTLPSDREIVFTCRFQRGARLLFEAWTKPEHLNRWWGCEGSSIAHCEIDLRVGGSWSLVMRMADGSDHPFHGTYREIVHPHRLVYTECYDMPQFGSPEWLTTVTFDETPAATIVTHTILHKSREVRDGHLQAGMQDGMVHALRRLDEHTAATEQPQ
ncbi:MAG TPA: SRPBCC domain-containing protein [Edaphobacter sp.]|nr:SRPBCC domain-containing protein [Edaphobacter sp.]